MLHGMNEREYIRETKVKAIPIDSWILDAFHFNITIIVARLMVGAYYWIAFKWFIYRSSRVRLCFHVCIIKCFILDDIEIRTRGKV